jgi:hypothetical protein
MGGGGWAGGCFLAGLAEDAGGDAGLALVLVLGVLLVC